MNGFLKKIIMTKPWMKYEVIWKGVEFCMDVATEWMNESISKRESLKPNAKPDEYQRLNQDFVLLRGKMQDTLSDIEKELQNGILRLLGFYEGLMDELNEKGILSDADLDIKMSEVRRVLESYEGFVDNELSKSLSFMNPRLMDVLTMSPGFEKEDKMNAFMQSAIDTILVTMTDMFEKDTTQLLDLLADDVADEIDVLQRRADGYAMAIDDLLVAGESMQAHKERMVSDALVRLEVSEALKSQVG
ncbi:hypothetical protein SZL87_15675 [Exiguobacterium indicum]|uniref:Uncharacterized protein n=1 Tax=Exiguobacterium indicum TaxID=296995 RepID=A0ABU8ELR3_9BACL